MTQIAFTTYEKVLVELRSALRGDDFKKQDFIDRMKLIDEMIIDQTGGIASPHNPPAGGTASPQSSPAKGGFVDKFAKKYNKKFPSL